MSEETLKNNRIAALSDEELEGVNGGLPSQIQSYPVVGVRIFDENGQEIIEKGRPTATLKQ